MELALKQRALELRPPMYVSLGRFSTPLLVAGLICLALHFVVQPAGGPFVSKVLLDVGINIILAVSLTMVNGFTGQFSMGHAGFMAIGGYVAGAITYYGSIKAWGRGATDVRTHGGAFSQTIVTQEIAGLPILGLFLLAGIGLGVAALIVRSRANTQRGAFLGLMLGLGGVGVALLGWLLNAGAAWSATTRALQEIQEFALLTRGDLLFIAGTIVGGLAAALVGFLVGLPSLRLRGDYLAIVTLGFGEIVRVVLQASENKITSVQQIQETPFPQLMTHLGRALGFTGLPFYSTIFWVYLWVMVTLIVIYRLKTSTFGRAFLSIREDEIAAEAMGIRTTRYKVSAFVISAFFAGVAGSLYAHLLGSINAGELGFLKSFDVIIMVVLGGLGSISGAVLAAAVLTLLPELLRTLGLWPWGLLLLAFLFGVIIWRSTEGLRRGVAWLIWAAYGVLLIVAAILIYAYARNVSLGEFRMVIYSLLLIDMMLARPQGLFGIHELWELWRGKRARGPKRAAALGDSRATEGRP